jgi:hypothetical protein
MTFPPRDPHAGALADFLRREAAAVSLSLEMTGFDRLVHVGLALLDAAAHADRLPTGDAALAAFSDAGLFRSAPDGVLRFVATSQIQHVLLGPVHGALESGEEVLAHLVDAVAEGGPDGR